MRWKKAGAGLLLCFLFAAMLGCLPGLANTAQFAGGSGTAEDPYKITTAAHLNNVRHYPAACFVLCNDIVFTDGDFAAGGAFYNDGTGWLPIGYGGTTFSGTLDGKGYSVKNLQMRRTGTVSYAYFGLFSVINNSGTVKDLHMTGENIEINSDTTVVAGGIAGATLGRMTDCSVDGTITVTSSGFSRAGGVSGITDPNAVFRSNVNKSTVTVSGGTGYAGGVVGHLRGTASECINEGAVVIKNSKTARGGGIVGYQQQGEIRNCFNVGSVTVTGTGNYRNAGGIAGAVNGTVTTSYNAGTVKIESPAPTANDGVGGVAGKLESEAEISACYYLADSYSTAAGTSLSATEMRSAASFAGFDFTTAWTMEGNADYHWPELSSVSLGERPHDWSKTVTNPTCTKAGETGFTCILCGIYKAESILPAAGHTFSDWWNTVNPSCTQSGTQMRRCSVCNATETQTVSATGHRYSDSYVSKQPSCTKAGVRTQRCALCSASVTEEIPPTGHTYEEWVIVKSPTCEKQGTRERVCLPCGSKESEIVAPLGHQFLEPEVLQLPTCTEPGTERGECYQCEEYTSQSIPPTGHSFGEEQIVKSATETEAGLSEHTCTVCGVTEQTEIPMLSPVTDTDTDESAPPTDPTDTTDSANATDSTNDTDSANPSVPQTPSDRGDSHGTPKNPRSWIYWALGGAWSLFAAGAWLFLRR